MTIQLIEGEFIAAEAMDLLTQMIHIKIRYHENKIAKDGNEEDLKFRETKIKNLQKELYELRHLIEKKRGKLRIEALVQITERSQD